jgi:D-proline reductase (dithiol) PrdB
LVTSAGIFLEGEQEPFDAEREKRDPTWGDPTYRVLPHDLAGRKIASSHLHINTADILADHNVALPTDVLDEMVADGTVGSATDAHVSVMGFQAAGLDVWRNETAPAIVSLFRDEGADGVVLAPV